MSDALERLTIPRPTDRDDWLTLRDPFVGASEVAALFGEHPFLSAGDLAARKLHPELRTEDGAAMKRGRMLEAAIAAWCAEERALELSPPEVCYVVERLVIATLDYEVVGRAGAVEVKTTSHYVSEPERYWWWQCQAQLLATGFEWVLIACLDASLALQCWTVHPDPDAAEAILERSKAFLDQVRRGIIPDDAPLTYRTVQELHPRAVVTRKELDERTTALLRELRAIQARIRREQGDEDRYKAMIAAKLGDATDGVVDGRVVVTWRPMTRHTVDVKALRRAYPDIANEFEQATTTRRLLVK